MLFSVISDRIKALFQRTHYIFKLFLREKYTARIFYVFVLKKTKRYKIVVCTLIKY